MSINLKLTSSIDPDGTKLQDPVSIDITNRPIFIGRSPKCDLVLNDKRCSAKHISIRILEDKAIIMDLNSSNGMLINGEKVDEAIIYISDEVQIGQTKFTLDLEKMTDEEKQLYTKKNSDTRIVDETMMTTIKQQDALTATKEGLAKGGEKQYEFTSMNVKEKLSLDLTSTFGKNKKGRKKIGPKKKY